MAKINIEYNGKKYAYDSGIRLIDIAQDFKGDFKYPILVARVNNDLMELNNKIEKDSIVEFYDCSGRIGNIVYQKGLIYLLVYAIKECFGEDKDIEISHAIDKGLYVETNFDVDEEGLKKITDKMNEVVKANLPIDKIVVKRKEAIEYYKSKGNEVKADSLLYNTNTYINIYKLGGLNEYFYSKMPINTSVFTKFRLQLMRDRVFILQTPVSYLDGKVPEYVHHEKMFEAFDDLKEWGNMLNIRYVADVNKLIMDDKIQDVIRMNELTYDSKLLGLAKKINREKDKIKMILIAGPSSSGKTTSARKLSLYLKTFGVNPVVISLDDYFVEREETPKKENGKYDFEALRAVDLELFNKQMNQLLAGEEVTVPTFNFVTGTKSFEKNLKLHENDVMIIEGLHCLNEELTKSIPQNKKFKIYVCPLTNLNIDKYNRLSSSDNRFLRRMVRDHRTRGYSVDQVFDMWGEVRAGEEEYVFPYQDEADYVLNTAMLYEMGVLKMFAESLLYTVSPDSKHYDDAKRLMNLLKIFLVIPDRYVPDDAILKEFIGGGFFHN